VPAEACESYRSETCTDSRAPRDLPDSCAMLARTAPDERSGTRHMVALPIRPTGGAGGPRKGASGPLAALFLSWRRLVTAAFRGVASGGRRLASSRPARAMVMAVRYVRDPAGTLACADADGRARLKQAGATALALGVALSFLVPAAVTTPLVRRFLAAGWTAAWALARLFIMRTVAKNDLADRRSVIDDAWGPALLPYAFAVVDPLPFAALAVSGLLTLRGLRALGVDRREARRVVVIAFGAQVAAELVGWIARGGLVYVLAIRG
jgi:hypothetical protein